MMATTAGLELDFGVSTAHRPWTTTAGSQSVGLVMTVITNPYFTEVVQGIEDELARDGYSLLLGDSHDDPERELRLLHDLHQRRVDGSSSLPQETPG
jgi:LacI family transcriptional regulator